MRVLLVIACLTLLAGCSIAPPLSQSQTVEMSGNIPDAGLMYPVRDLEGNFMGYRMRQTGIDKYNALVLKSGAQLIPPVKVGDGYVPYPHHPGFYLLDAQHMDIFQGLDTGALP